MNYRHAFHAGNFADCFKHALLVPLLRALFRKPAPIFVLDTHAGAGCYDLNADSAQRTGEAGSGIQRLMDRSPPALAEYLGLVRRLGRAMGTNVASEIGGAVFSSPPLDLSRGPEQHGAASASRDEPGDDDRRDGANAPVGLYPGSPLLIRALLRPDDRLACCELRPDDHAALRTLFRGDTQVAVHRRDGWEALKGLLPPKQTRGLVLIDPPYEDPREFNRLARGLTEAHARFRTGVFAAWYPVKHRAPVRAFLDALTVPDTIAMELLLRDPLDPARLNGCGLAIVNPPHGFEETARPILDALLARLGSGEPGAAVSIAQVTDE